MREIKLYTPKKEELSFRRELLKDTDTMEFNAGLDLGIDGYDYDSGCMDFNESKWDKWYKDKIESNKSFYFYVGDGLKDFGEAFISSTGNISIIIKAEFRRRGIAKKALELLIDKAFNEYGFDRLTDEIPEDRGGSVSLFKQFNFIEKESFIQKRFNKDEKVLLLELEN